MTEMKIKDIKPGMNDLDLTVEIDMVAPINKSWDYGEMKRATIIVKDDTGDIRMTVFGDELVKKVKEKMKLKLTKAYVTEYNGIPQLNTTRENPPEIIN